MRGVVVDSSTGERIPYANVTIAGTNLGGATNTNGFYILLNVPRGKRGIVVSAVGYQKQTREIEVEGEEAVTLNFHLPPRAVEVSEVLVEAQRQTEPTGGTSLHLLTTQDLLRVPVPVQSDVLRSLQTLPGVVSAADVSSKFYVRGGAGDQNLILLDGMKIYNPFHAFGVFSIFDPDIIGSADVHTGAFPAGYGNRLSSVLSMTTRQGNSSRVAAKAEVNFLASKLQLEGPMTEGNSWIISGRTSTSDRALRHFIRNPAPTSFYDVFFKATLGNATGRNSLRGFFSGDDVSPDSPQEPDYTWRNQALAYSVGGLVSDRIYVDAVAYTNKFRVKRDVKASKEIPPAESIVGEDGMRMDVTFYSESRDLTFSGFEFTLPNVEYDYTNRNNIQRKYSDVDTELWLWFRRQLTFGKLQADLGVHSDLVSLFSHGFDLQALQPRFGFAYRLSDLWKARLSYGVFNQHMITLGNEDDITSLFEAWITIPRELRFEEAHHLVLGLEGNLSHALSSSIQVYYKRYTSLVLYNREKYIPSDPDFVNGKGSSYGVEALLRYGIPLLDLYAAYTLGWTSVTTGGFTYSPRYDRRHSMNLMGEVHVTDDVDVTLRLEYGSGYPYTQTAGYYDRLLFDGAGDPEDILRAGTPYTILGSKNGARLPAYARLDGSVTYRFSFDPLRGSIGVHVANIADRKNILSYDRKTGQRLNMLGFYPTAVLKLEYSW